MKIGYVKSAENACLFDFLASIEAEQKFGIDWLETDLESWDQFDFFFVPATESESFLKKFTSVSSKVDALGVCDVIFKKNGRYWPDNFLSEAFKRKLVEKAPGLDTRAYAYVAGHGAWAETALKVLIQTGFSKIKWVCENRIDIEESARLLQTKYFGIDLTLLESADLTLEPANGSILVSSLPVDASPQFRQDIAYLNFIQKPGLIVDFWVEPLENQLLIESEGVGLQTLSGVELALEYWIVAQHEMERKPGEELGKVIRTSKSLKEHFISFLKSRPLSR